MMSDWKSRLLVPTFRNFWLDTPDGPKEYVKVMTLVKKYGCPVSKVSDGRDWIRVYFDIPSEKEEEFLKEEDQV